MKKLRVLFAASEVAGFAKTGGLADVASSLPKALAGLGVDVTVVAPFYRSCRLAGEPYDAAGVFRVPLGDRIIEGRFQRSKLPGSEVGVVFVDVPDLFDRDDPHRGRGLYQFTNEHGDRDDYPDNAERYAVFCRALLELPRVQGDWPDLIHLNDWQTGLAPAYLREVYAREGIAAVRNRYAAVRTLFTVHNLAYQGNFPETIWPLLGLPDRLFDPDHLEFYGHVSYLKGGLVGADALTTVSPTYAREIQTVYFGCGMQGLLLKRTAKLTGIVNGIDSGVWDPATDRHLPARYSAAAIEPGKPACKKALQRLFGLVEESTTFLLGIVSRLADQKGLDLVAALGPSIVERGMQLVLLGTGDPKLHTAFSALAEKYPRSIGLCSMLDESLAHLVEAGADAFLMPSRYEPCGLNQLYSLRYGTVPIVRATGGLADTVVDYTHDNLVAERATGFTFIPASPSGLDTAIDRAYELFRKSPDAWRKLMLAGMRQDWSWGRSAEKYLALYRSILRDDP
jgi:starch synthase